MVNRELKFVFLIADRLPRPSMGEVQKWTQIDVRYGSKAELLLLVEFVCFGGVSGHRWRRKFANRPRSTVWHVASPAKIPAQKLANQSAQLATGRHALTWEA
jgi:hypothetical protein